MKSRGSPVSSLILSRAWRPASSLPQTSRPAAVVGRSEAGLLYHGFRASGWRPAASRNCMLDMWSRGSSDAWLLSLRLSLLSGSSLSRECLDLDACRSLSWSACVSAFRLRSGLCRKTRARSVLSSPLRTLNLSAASLSRCLRSASCSAARA